MTTGAYDIEHGIMVVKCETAEDLLSNLRPEKGFIWQAPHREKSWIFRGQADAKQNLTPSALRRPLSDTHRLFSDFPANLTNWKDQIEEEQGLMFDFCARADLHGFEIPGDHPELRDLDSTQGKASPVDFPPVEHRGMYALAQHYGIPTRFLDWTISPTVAAYFAVESVARQRSQANCKSPEHVAIWAVDRIYISECLRLENPGAVVVTVPTVSNPNLHAQKGLFTLVRYRSENPTQNYMIPPLDELVGKAYSKNKDLSKFSHPVMVKFELCATQASKLLWLLALDGISATTMFRSLHGVVRGMEEKWFH